MFLILERWENVPKTRMMFRFASPQAGSMSESLSYFLLRKMISGCVILMMIMSASGEEFGTSRWKTHPVPQLPSQQALPNVVRIIAFDSTGQSFGTGSYIGTYGEYGVILTNWHVIFTEETEGLVHVHFPSGFSSFGAVIKSDLTWDLALIAISKPPLSVPMLTISQTPSKPGDPLWIAGYGSGTYRIAEGRCVRYLVPENLTKEKLPLYEIMEVSVSARKGDSGGPILNQKGELAGVLFGSDMVRNTAGSYCERVNRFLMETQSEMVRLPSRPETHFASKEKEGPLHSLKESRMLTLKNMSPKYSPSSSSSSTSLDVKLPPRRYIPLEHPVSNERSSVLQQSPQTNQKSVVPNTPFSSHFSKQEIQTAVWTEAAPKIGASVPSSSVIQTAHLTPLEALQPTNVIASLASSANPSVANRYVLKISADQHDIFFVLFMSVNLLTALGLTYFAMRLLAKK